MTHPTMAVLAAPRRLPGALFFRVVRVLAVPALAAPAPGLAVGTARDEAALVGAPARAEDPCALRADVRHEVRP